MDAQDEVSGRANSRTDAKLAVDEASGRRRGACVVRPTPPVSAPARPGAPSPFTEADGRQARQISSICRGSDILSDNADNVTGVARHSSHSRCYVSVT